MSDSVIILQELLLEKEIEPGEWRSSIKTKEVTVAELTNVVDLQTDKLTQQEAEDIANAVVHYLKEEK